VAVAAHAEAAEAHGAPADDGFAPQLRRLAVLVQSPPTPTLAKALAVLRAAAQKREFEVREVPLVRVEEVKAALPETPVLRRVDADAVSSGAR
jgi:hypothetical protein